jgi:thioredoxin-related protein
MRWAKALAALGAVCALLAWGAPASAAEGGERSYEPIKTDGGLLAQPWYLHSFLELQYDLAEASEQGKRFVIFWEQPGCPYCERMHKENFTIPAINDYVRKHFTVLQLNLRGDRRVTDFDGEVLAEKKLARKYGVTFTPTLQFFPDDPSKTKGKPGHEVEVERVQGYLKPMPFLATFKYVADKVYRQDMDLRTYIDMRAEAALEKAGFQPQAW